MKNKLLLFVIITFFDSFAQPSSNYIIELSNRKKNITFEMGEPLIFDLKIQNNSDCVFKSCTIFFQIWSVDKNVDIQSYEDTYGNMPRTRSHAGAENEKMDQDSVKIHASCNQSSDYQVDFFYDFLYVNRFSELNIPLFVTSTFDNDPARKIRIKNDTSFFLNTGYSYGRLHPYYIPPGNYEFLISFVTINNKKIIKKIPFNVSIYDVTLILNLEN